MTISLTRLVLACAVALGVAASAAATTPTAGDSSTPAKKTTKAAAKSKAKAAPVVEATPEEAEPDVADTVTSEYACELGNKITIFKNDNDDSHIALRWKKRLHRLTRVGTTTGAQRFENPNYGLIWIGIPAKGMLLDSKLNRQLANECKTVEQAVVVKQG
jgi:membrane-bound inhibitor of C-type lysozyme